MGVTWEQELLTLPEHLSWPLVFSVFRVARSLVFCGMFCRSLFVLLLLAIVLSVHFWFTTSDYLPLVFLNFSYLQVMNFKHNLYQPWLLFYLQVLNLIKKCLFYEPWLLYFLQVMNLKCLFYEPWLLFYLQVMNFQSVRVKQDLQRNLCLILVYYHTEVTGHRQY